MHIINGFYETLIQGWSLIFLINSLWRLDCRSLHTKLTATGSWTGFLKIFALNSNGQMTADEHRASSEQCQNNYSFFYMCCRYCLHATCQYCARNHRHCFVHRFSETNPPIRVWSTGKLDSYVQLAADLDRCWCVSGGGRTELARLDPCLGTVSGFLGPPQTSVS